MRSLHTVGVLLLVYPWMAGLAAEDPVIEEIMVTAQRTEENARTVPMSISAFTETMIKDRQIIGITDLQLNTPNLTYSQDNFGGAKVVIRGIGDTAGGFIARSIASPGVPVHLNGVSVLTNLNTLEFYDIAQVEVMRGPQGTLYGRSATAGAINIVTRRPEFTDFGGYVDLEYGDYDHVRVKAH